MNRLSVTFVVAAALLAACGGSDEEPDGAVVGRVVEVSSGEAGGATWVQVAADTPFALEETLNPEGVSGGAWLEVGPEGESFRQPRVGRFRLTVRDAMHVYEVLVPYECFTAVRVGDLWPSELDECR